MARILVGEEKDLGGFQVKRVLPHREKAMVGPFIFFDQMGPAEFPAGKGVNVRPHPHIGLATVTYLFEGSILHRDSLGSVQEIFPGDVNWMTAGKGIVHSERETIEVRAVRHRLHGIQCWIALPEDMEYIEPSFLHLKKCRLPHILREGVMMRLIAGDAYNRTSPVKTYSPMFYLDVVAEADAWIERPCGGFETACYPLSGKVEIAGDAFGPGDFALLDDDDEGIRVKDAGRFLLLGGARFEKTPHKHWNFVSFDRERIRKERERWKAGGFPAIPGDEEEKIPLPDTGHVTSPS